MMMMMMMMMMTESYSFTRIIVRNEHEQSDTELEKIDSN